MEIIKSLKRVLENLVAAAEYDMVFSRLRVDILQPATDNSLYQDTIAVEARYRDALRQGNLNLLDLKEINQNLSGIAQALLWLIGRLALDNLSDRYRAQADEHRNIPLIHALTCDRYKQKAVFDEHYFFDPGPAEKFRFFYLYGDARQEHESLAKRFAYDRNGQINFRWRQKHYVEPKPPLFRFCKPEFSESARLFEMYVLRDLYACFFESNDPKAPDINPVSSKLTDLLKSPDIAQLGPTGHVFVLLTIDDHNWREDVTPLVVKRLFEGFYKCQVPPEAPSFYFFFGLEYSQPNTAVKDQVLKAIEAAEHGTPLELLRPFSAVEIAEWFSRYKELCGTSEADEMVAQLFGNSVSFDMLDVELKLTEVIEKHNTRLVQ